MGQHASYLQLLIIALAVMGPLLGFAVKMLGKHRAKRRALERERTRRDEMLRTGRAP